MDVGEALRRVSDHRDDLWRLDIVHQPACAIRAKYRIPVGRELLRLSCELLQLPLHRGALHPDESRRLPIRRRRRPSPRLQDLVCRLLLEKKKKENTENDITRPLEPVTPDLSAVKSA